MGSRHLPIGSIIAYTGIIIAIILCAVSYGTIFPQLLHYFPAMKWIMVKQLLEFLLIFSGIVGFVELISSLFVKRRVKENQRSAKWIRSMRHFSSTTVQGIIVLLIYVNLILSIAIFGCISALALVRMGFGNVCNSIPNNGTKDDICFDLRPFGGIPIHCDEEYTLFCLQWKQQMLMTLLASGSAVLCFSNLIMLGCSVGNFMRYKHQIVVRVTERKLPLREIEEEVQEGVDLND